MRTLIYVGFLLVTCLGLAATAVIFESHWSFYPAPPGAAPAFQPIVRPGTTVVRATPHGSEMVRVEGGEFLVGAPDGTGLPDEHPQRRAQIASFWLDRTEVTCAQYAAFLNQIRVAEQWRRSYIFARGEERPGPDKACLEVRDGKWLPVPGTEPLPMYWVSSFGARAFCEFHGLRLPTEAEWEAAAQVYLDTAPDGALRGDSAKHANLRQGSARSPLLPAMAPDDRPAPIHLAGNVSEFVLDKYAEDAWARLDPQRPQAVQRGTHGVIKGGSFADPPDHARIRRRIFSHALQCRFEFTGFRCAADAR